MKRNRAQSDNGDPALRVRQRMETRGKRRFVKRLLERNAQWRRLVAGSMAAGMAAVLASLLMLGEAAAMMAS